MTIVWLRQQSTSTAEVGGKGASLMTLLQGGFPVPPGFVVAADAYRQFVAANRLQPLIDSMLETPELQVPKVARSAAADLTAALAGAAIPDQIEEAIGAAFRELQQQSAAAVAVRSSALSEDAASASSAGLYETYLNVRDLPAVLEAVRRCYASLWSARAIQYRAFKKLGGRDEAMAVVVMTQVPSEAAGVVFTANPLNGERDQIVVNASWGLGEAVVSGRVTPDSFTLDKGTLAVLGRDISEKETEIVDDPSGLSGTVERGVARERMTMPVLSEPQLATLGRLCREIEGQYGRPMDVEWAIAGGVLYILQARPITALS